ncbi:MAG: RIP metalloprotease RseP [Gemmatimonadales bacterium]
MNTLYAIAILLVVLGILIFIHEAGHFLAAKWAGIWVHRFALGLGTPIKALSFVRGGTEYAICWVPLGGYVKMASREEEATTSALEGGAVGTVIPPGMFYEDQPVWKRMVVTLAGVTMNSVFAILVFFGLALANGRSIDPETRVGRVIIAALPHGAEALRQLKPGDRVTAVAGKRVSSWDEVAGGIVTAPGNDVAVTVNDSLTVLLRLHSDQLRERHEAALAVQPFRVPVVGGVVPGRAAERAGLAVGDTVLSVDGTLVLQWYDMTEIITNAPGRPLAFEVNGPKGHRTLTITPETQKDSAGKAMGRIGIELIPPSLTEPYSVAGAFVAGVGATGAASLQIFRTIRGMMRGRVSTRDLGGPILIGQMAAQSARLGIGVFLGFLGLISINLAVLNLLPIPILDGGQAVFLIYEGIFRRPMPLKAREALMAVGLVLIVLLMILANWNDVRRLLGW